MYYTYDKPEEEADETKLSYDLRQRRAKIIGDCIQDAVDACKQDDYSAWLKSIDDLKMVSFHMWKDKDDVNTEYTNIKQKVIDAANKYPTSWTKENINKDAVALFDKVLRKLMEYVMLQIEQSHGFGTISIDDEDDI